MAGVFSGSSKVNINGTYRDSGRDLTVPACPVVYEDAESWASGSSLKLYDDTISLAGASQNLDLYGVLTDMYGTTLNYATIRAILIVNKATTAGYTVTLSGNWLDGSVLGGTSPTMALHYGGTLYVTSPGSGYTVTAATDDILTLNPGANTISVDVMIWGTVA